MSFAICFTNAFALVKRNNAFGMDGFAGKVIWERGDGVEAGDRRVLGKFAGTATATAWPRASKTIARELVVP